ncbi:MAG: peptide deformylase [Synechococcales cyanobacterium T60_A2020_003]|nr:peptide deformylase [Synechococcales cyanobacterium T60_A2020_003]
MKPLEIVQLGNPVLRQIAQPVSNIQDEWVKPLAQKMLATLVESRGVGIAAPQVGQPYRILVVASHPNARYPHAPQMEPTVMINPRLIDHSDAIVKDWEGCLSVPGIRGLVPRYKEIEVEYTGLDDRIHRTVLTDFVARIFQHEFDHLNGIVFLDHVEDVQDMMAEQEYLKQVVRV